MWSAIMAGVRRPLALHSLQAGSEAIRSALSSRHLPDLYQARQGAVRSRLRSWKALASFLLCSGVRRLGSKVEGFLGKGQFAHGLDMA